MTCEWPQGVCACWEQQQAVQKDHDGRVWMHCEEGLTLTNASMARFMMFCLTENIEIGEVYPFNRKYPRSLVLATVRLREDQFEAFEAKTGGKLRKPPVIQLS